MKNIELINNIGEIVYINGLGDLAFYVELRPLIYNKNPLKLIKITKSGLAYLQSEDGKFYTVPPRNVYKNQE